MEKIGLSLSGGGYRATVMHLGVLARLAEENQVENTTFLSTVSGGSLFAGMAFAANGYRWPNSQEYIDVVVPRIFNLMTATNLQKRIYWRVILEPWTLLQSRANYLSGLMQKEWGITANLNALPKEPRWVINTTCFETGVDFQFETARMGDYKFGYVDDPELPLSDAMAASAGFPVGIGPLTLKTLGHKWYTYDDGKRKYGPPKLPAVHLWDGGAYDNLGIESIFKPDEGWSKNVDMLIVSDASGFFPEAKFDGALKGLERLVGIMQNQVRSLRSRMVLHHITDDEHAQPGVYLRIGKTCEYILSHTNLTPAEKKEICADTLPETDCHEAAIFKTTIRQLEPWEYTLLFRHGFELADYTLHGFYPNQFEYIGYMNTRWAKEYANFVKPSVN